MYEFLNNIINFNSFIFFFNLLFFGIGMAFVEDYLFLFIINKLNGNVSLCGLTVTIMVFIGEVPIFYNSDYLLNKIGILGLLFISHISYSIRVIGYTLLPLNNKNTSYFILLLEPLHGFTYAGMWIAWIECVARMIQIKLQGTMQGI